jgi:hypothetical protein
LYLEELDSIWAPYGFPTEAGSSLQHGGELAPWQRWGAPSRRLRETAAVGGDTTGGGYDGGYDGGCGGGEQGGDGEGDDGRGGVVRVTVRPRPSGPGQVKGYDSPD